MKIKMLAPMVGPEIDLKAGDVASFEKAEAIRLIERGLAVPVRSRRQETATSEAPELTSETHAEG